MDQFLDAMYGTRENISASPDLETLEKNAEAELLVNALQQEGWDPSKIDNLSGEDVLKVAHALFGDKSVLVQAATKTAEEAPPFVAKEEAPAAPAKEKCKDCGKEECECKKGEETMEQKVASADYLGRLMAHSFVDEMAQMEKKAQYDQVLQAKIAQIQANTAQSAQPSTESLVAKIAAKVTPQLTPEQQLEQLIDQRVAEKLAAMQRPQIDEEKARQGLELLKAAGVDISPFVGA